MTLTKNLLVGVYGTGTKTYARVETESGELVGEGVSGTANFCLSIKQAWDSIHDAINQSLIKAGLSLESKDHLFHAFLGVKNTEVPEACHAFTQANFYFDTLGVVSDALVQCVGAHNNKPGTVIIVDEGVTGYSITNEKASIKVGGYGFPLADKGSTAWLGCEVVRLTLDWQDGYIDSSPMLNDVFNYFQEDLNNIVEWSMKASPKNFAELYKSIIPGHIKKKDPYAVKLMYQVIREIEKVYSNLIKKQKKDASPCCLFGELSTYVQSHVSSPLCKNLVKPKHSGTEGAIILLREKLK